jgi:hypothetical protein
LSSWRVRSLPNGSTCRAPSVATGLLRQVTTTTIVWFLVVWFLVVRITVQFINVHFLVARFQFLVARF